jgi:hypothetical protein
LAQEFLSHLIPPVPILDFLLLLLMPFSFSSHFFALFLAHFHIWHIKVCGAASNASASSAAASGGTRGGGVLFTAAGRNFHTFAVGADHFGVGAEIAKPSGGVPTLVLIRILLPLLLLLLWLWLLALLLLLLLITHYNHRLAFLQVR